MMDTPTISIIIPIYNSERYLARCLDSVLNQTYQFTELILVDDGSQDKSGEICDQYALIDSRIKVYHNSNQGASASRNFGLSMANGDYVSFIDSDDWIQPTFYEDFFGNDNFLYDIYFQNYVLHKADGSTVIKKMKPISIREGNPHEAIFYLMKEVKFGWSWIKLFKRSIIEENGIKFDESVNLREDEIFAYQYCKYIKTICVRSQAGYHYYIYSNSLTRSFKSPREYVRISKILRKESLYLQTDGVIDYINNYYLSNLCSSVFKMYNKDSEPLSYEERCIIIKDFLEFYSLHKELTLTYKTYVGKILYGFLWFIKSPSLIDWVLQKKFHVKLIK